MTEPALPQVHLKPGELVVTTEPRLVVTVLGSCLAVTMFSPRLKLAAMCHAMLPTPRPSPAAEAPEDDGFKYLSGVVPAMAARFRSAGVEAREVEVKIFGGGNVISAQEHTPSELWLGNVNVDWARELLRREALHIRAENVGGRLGRKILFNTQTGEVLHKHLDRLPGAFS